MSEKKEFKSLDVGASARIPWKIAKGLRENVGFKDDGSVEIAKNLEIDGKLKLNSGFEPIHTYTLETTLYSIEVYAEKEYADTFNFFGTLTSNDGYRQFCFGEYALENDKVVEAYMVTAEYSTPPSYYSYVANNLTNEILATTTQVDSKQEKLTLHNLTLTANSKTYNITLQSTNNLKVDSIADLRTILNIKATTDSLITPVCASDLTSTACLQVTTSLCKIGTDNVTAVSDRVTTL